MTMMNSPRSEDCGKNQDVACYMIAWDWMTDWAETEQTTKPVALQRRPRMTAAHDVTNAELERYSSS